jgi:hypothetical protein
MAMNQYVAKPASYHLDTALNLSGGVVYLPESYDPDDPQSPWRVVADAWVDYLDGAVCVMHVDDPDSGTPVTFKRGRRGVWIADYS